QSVHDRSSLPIAHMVILHSHQCGARVCFGIAVSIISQDLSLLLALFPAFQIFPKLFVFLLLAVVCFSNHKHTANRVGGAKAPTSHTTVRTVPYTAVQSHPCTDSYRLRML